MVGGSCNVTQRAPERAEAEAALFAAFPTGPMSCSGSGADPEAAPACAASVAGPAPPVSAPAALPASTAAESKASPAGTAGGPGAGVATAGTGPVAARAGEPAERRGPGERRAGGGRRESRTRCRGSGTLRLSPVLLILLQLRWQRAARLPLRGQCLTGFTPFRARPTEK